MRSIILILMITILNGCAFIVAKETAKVVDIITEDDPNPEKKKKILENKKKKQNKAKEFYCSKVKDVEKCG